MKFTRKEFIRASSIITGGLLLPGSKALARLMDENSNFKIIRKNIGIYTERGGTMGWLVSDDAVVVVDSQFPDTAKNFMASLQKKTPRKIDLLFNTHHHGDHTSGNVYLKDFTSKIVAHKNCPVLQKKSYGGDPNKPQIYANTTFNDEWMLVLGKEKIHAKYFGAAHTGGDAVIHFMNSNVVHLGDLVFNKTFPYIDSNGGGSIKGWSEVLAKISNHFSKDTLYIFGHAASPEIVTGSVEDLIATKDYLNALLHFVSKEIKNGKTKEQIAAATEIPGFAHYKERWEGARKLNLESAYDELMN